MCSSQGFSGYVNNGCSIVFQKDSNAHTVVDLALATIGFTVNGNIRVVENDVTTLFYEQDAIDLGFTDLQAMFDFLVSQKAACASDSAIAITEGDHNHDFTDTSITVNNLRLISGNPTDRIDNMTIVAKGIGVTWQRGNELATLDVGRSFTLGNIKGQEMLTGWVVNNPNGVVVNIVWDKF